MHPEAREGFARMLAAAPIGPSAARLIVDIGGADINGNVYDLLPAHAALIRVDQQYAEGVTIVADATTHPDEWGPGLTGAFDIVLCTEVLEHVQKWPEIVESAAALLAPHGVLILTCASTGRAPHGAHGASRPGPGEWYGNVAHEDLHAVLDGLFTRQHVEYQPSPGDLYAWAASPRPQ